MRNNLPIIRVEIALDDDATLVSYTDPAGTILRVNRELIQVSGFSEAELVSQPHHVVRHPDMPPELFADFCQMLQADRLWMGVIKNRAKCGAHYWVQAHVTPVHGHGRVTTYMSVRCKTSRAAVVAVEHSYAPHPHGAAQPTPSASIPVRAHA